MDGYRYDFKRADEAWRWLAKKAPMIGFNVVAFFGPTSAGKSSIVNYILGGDIVDVKNVACTTTMHFIRGLPDAQFRAVYKRFEKGEAVTNDDVAPYEDTGASGKPSDVKPMTKDQLWPAMLPHRDKMDYRFGKLYVTCNDNRLHKAFVGSEEHAYRDLLRESVFTVYNVDRVTEDESLKRRLLRTIVIDTRGLDTQKSSSAGVQVLEWANRHFFVMPQAFSQNAAPAMAYETMMMQHVFGDNGVRRMWQLVLASCLQNYDIIRTLCGPAIFMDAAGALMKDDSLGSKIDVGLQQLWGSTTFVRGLLDTSLKHRHGYEQALQDAGTALGYFTTKPIDKRVRHVAVPAYAQASEDLATFNEIDALRDEALDVRGSSTRESLCSMAQKYYEMQLKKSKSSWKEALPRYVANTDKFYAKQIVAAHCPKEPSPSLGAGVAK